MKTLGDWGLMAYSGPAERPARGGRVRPWGGAGDRSELEIQAGTTLGRVSEGGRWIGFSCWPTALIPGDRAGGLDQEGAVKMVRSCRIWDILKTSPRFASGLDLRYWEGNATREIPKALYLGLLSPLEVLPSTFPWGEAIRGGFYNNAFTVDLYSRHINPCWCSNHANGPGKIGASKRMGRGHEQVPMDGERFRKPLLTDWTRPEREGKWLILTNELWYY